MQGSSANYKRYDANSSDRMCAKLTAKSQTRERRVNKMEESGYSPEQLAKMQEEMFASAREKYNAGTTENGSGTA